MYEYVDAFEPNLAKLLKLKLEPAHILPKTESCVQDPSFATPCMVKLEPDFTNDRTLIDDPRAPKFVVLMKVPTLMLDPRMEIDEPHCILS
jgi:hypothetical protein